MPLFTNAAFLLAGLVLGPFASVVEATSCNADACVCIPAGGTCPSWMDDAYANGSDETINDVTLCVRYNGGSVDMGGSFGSGSDAVEGAIITLDGTTFTGPFDACTDGPAWSPEGSEDTSEAAKTAVVMAVTAAVVGSLLVL